MIWHFYYQLHLFECAFYFCDEFDIQNPYHNGETARVQRGDKIASIPEHMFKAALDADYGKSHVGH
jgi:hypothetical protein